jgi:MFS family permease
MVRRTTEKKVHRSTREDRMSTDYRATFRDLTLMVASSITIIGTTAIAASLPKMSDAFASTSHGHFLVKVSLTLPALTAGLCAVPMGMITDRWGRKQLFVVALILYSTAGSAGFFLNSLYAILVSRLLLGVAVSAVATCVTTLIADYTKNIGRAMGRQSLFMALGNVVFVFLGGLLASHDWRWPFLIYTIGFLLLPGVLLLISGRRSEAISAQPRVSKSAERIPLGAVVFIYLLLFVNMVAYFMVPVYLPFYLAAFSNGNSVRAGALLSVVGLAWAASSTQYKRLAQRLPFDRIMVITFSLLGGSYVLLGIASTYPVVVLALILTGAGLGSAIPNLNAWLLALTPPNVKGRVIGTMVFVTFLGQFISPVSTQPLTSALGIAESYLSAGFVMLAIALGTGLYLTARARQATRYSSADRAAPLQPLATPPREGKP